MTPEEARALAEQQRLALLGDLGYRPMPTGPREYFEAYARSEARPENMGRRMTALEIANGRLRFEVEVAQRLARQWRLCAWAIAAVSLLVIALLCAVLIWGR